MTAIRTRLSWPARTPVATIAVVLVLLLLAVAVLGPIFAESAATTINVRQSFKGPSAEHWLGTDNLGRDVLARIIVGTRSTLLLALLATCVGGALGIALGASAAVLPPRAGRLLSSTIAILVAFPPLLLAIFFSVIFGLGAKGAVLAVGAAYLPGFARFTETLARSVVQREYVEAARLLAVGRLRIVRSHVLPNIAEPVALYFTIHIGSAILALASLSFIGFGVQAPSYDWGSLLAVAIPKIYLTPAAALGPVIAIVLAGLAFNLVGEAYAARDRDRKVRVRRPRRRAERQEQDDTDRVEPVLEVSDLTVQVPVGGRQAPAVRGISFSVAPGEIVGVVGESGSGKSLSVLAAADMLINPVIATAGVHRFLGTDLRPGAADRGTRDKVLGAGLALVYQDPNGTFNPALRLHGQVTEGARTHLGLSARQATDRATGLLGRVALRGGAGLLRRYQHQFSGGMKQRLALATGLMCRPRLLIADEPTSALDVTVQAQILTLLREVREDGSTAVLMVSHDLAVIAELCDRVLVMYAGIIVEQGGIDVITARPAHPYTRALLRSSLDMRTPLDLALPVLDGTVPGPADPTPGCRFAARCPSADDRCRTTAPDPAELDPGHRVACWHPVPAPPVPADREALAWKA